MTIREWLDVYTLNGDAQLVCAWRKRAWRAMRPVVAQIDCDPSAWTVGKALKALDAACYAAKIKPSGKRWAQEYDRLRSILNADTRFWRAPTYDDRGVCAVATDLVELGKYDEALSLLREQAPHVLERPCPACGTPAGYHCHELARSDWSERAKADSPQLAVLKAAGAKWFDRLSLIVPHEARLVA